MLFIELNFGLFNYYLTNCPEPHETTQRKKSNCDVIYKIKIRNMMSLLESTNNYRIIRGNLDSFIVSDKSHFFHLVLELTVTKDQVMCTCNQYT